MSEFNLASAQARHLEAKSNAPYAFLREPLSVARHGYNPPMPGEPLGAFNDRTMRAHFGEWPAAPELESEEDMRVLKSLHSKAEETWRGVISTIEQVRADDDPTLNNEGRLKVLGRIVEPKLEELARTAEREFARVKARVSDVEADIMKAIRVVEAVDLAAHDAIRRYWKEQGESKEIRTAKVVLGASELDDPAAEKLLDTQTLQALAGAPHYLSGITPMQQAKAREHLAKRMAPDMVKRRDGLNAGLMTAAHALSTLDQKVKKLIDLDRARQLRERAKVHA